MDHQAEPLLTNNDQDGADQNTRAVAVLTRKDVASLMRKADYLRAVESAFRAEKEGRASSPTPMHIDGDGGVFHAKGAAFTDGRACVALKFNGNFPENAARFGLPTIQGAIFLCDAKNGALLAILDSIEVTLRRTAAASALAARHLARKDARILCICGCGDQGRAQAEALADVRSFDRGFAWDIDAAKAARFAQDMGTALGFAIEPVDDLPRAARSSDVIVTATTAAAPFLAACDVAPGAFVAAVGADSPYKNEIAPDLMKAAHVVTDATAQCAEMGDLRAAIAAGAVAPDGIYADLGDIVTGARPGRRRARDIFVFDSTGTALQDVASAATAFERAAERGVGRTIALAAL